MKEDMTQSQKLEALIQKAIDRDWQPHEFITIKWLPQDYAKNIAGSVIGMHRTRELIFNHENKRRPD